MSKKAGTERFGMSSTGFSSVLARAQKSRARMERTAAIIKAGLSSTGFSGPLAKANMARAKGGGGGTRGNPHHDERGRFGSG